MSIPPFSGPPPSSAVKLLGVHNVKSYGARGDGATDDTAAIQRAIDAAKVAHGVVHLPPGDYMVSAALNIDATVTVQGATFAPYDVDWENSSRIVVKLTALGINVFNCTAQASFYDLTITVEGADPATISGTQKTAGAGILAAGVGGFYIQRCCILFQYDAIKFTGAPNWGQVFIRDCEITSCTHDGIVQDTSTTMGEFFVQETIISNGNRTMGTGAGLRLRRTSGCYVTNVDVINFATGILLDPNNVVEYCWFTNVLADTCTLGWDIGGAGSGTLRDIFCNGCYAAIDGNYGAIVRSSALNVQWIGGVVNRADIAGFKIEGGTGLIFQGISFEGWSALGPGVAYKPMVLSGTVASLAIHGCISQATQAVDFASQTVSAYTMTGNIFPGGLANAGSATGRRSANVGITDA